MSNHESRKHQVDPHGFSGMYRSPADTSYQSSNRKVVRMKHHQDQYTTRSCVGHSKTYEVKVPTFANGKPEYFLQMMKEFKTATNGTGTTSATGKSHFLRTVLHGKSLIELYVLAGQVSSMTNGHLRLINEGLIGHFHPINALNKQKFVMRRSMQKY